MQKRQFLNLNEGDYIYVYSGGNLETQGRYINVVEDKNESFLCWRKHNGNKVYTNLNGISVETLNENTAYLQNTSDTSAQDYNKNYYNQGSNGQYSQNYDDTYNQGSNGQYNQNYDDTYNQGSNGQYSQNYDDTYNQGSNGQYNQNYDDTYNQGSNGQYS
ncbi:hypothetical protein, partial [Bacillus thuringiensis]|uniref:hypothetical protein n=1 Tax=Bacillus thuringiensis TaxID=1428 RepID=UPI002AB5CED9